MSYDKEPFVGNGLKQSIFKKIPKQSHHEFQNKWNELSEMEESLRQQMEERGFGNLSFHEFIEKEFEVVNQIDFSKTIGLQDEIRRLLDEKRDFDNIINAIFIEPGKLNINVDEAEELIRKEKGHIFQRSGKLVHIINTPSNQVRKKEWIKSHPETLIIREIDPPFLTEYLTKVGSWKKSSGSGQSCRSINAPTNIAIHLLSRGKWNLPVLTGIINAPTIREDGSILDIPGYDESSGIFFSPGNCTFEKVADSPTKNDAINSLGRVKKILSGFSFDGEESCSVALSAILTALVRKSITTAPLHGFTAPKMASGKSLLADVVSLIATGLPNSMISYANNETEERKRFLAVLMAGYPVVCIDNIEHPFGSPALCSILTQQEYQDRFLGESRNIIVPTNISFLATGNNLTFIGDLSTRSLLCKLDPKVEFPEERIFPVNLYKEIPAKRGQLVRDCLTILRAYCVTGRPSQGIKPYGRFEDWSDLVRSAIVWLDMPDPCDSRKEIESADPVRIQLGNLLTSWYDIFDEQSRLLRDVVKYVTEHTDEKAETLKYALLEIASNNKGEINQRTLGNKLSSYKGRIENNYRLETSGLYQNAILWKVGKVDE